MLAELNETLRTGDATSIRYHELALQRWLNQNFHVVEGYPVPVLFSSPMDAYAHFKELWASEGQNPFSYLYDVKDANGTPLYRPYPEPAPYPIISVFRRNISWRASQSYSSHRWRRLSWPTTVTSGTVTRDLLGNVAQAQMPMAWDFSFQVDFHCLRPDTMAVFVEHVMRKFRRAGGVPQTWITVAYPYYGSLFARAYIQGGEISQLTPEEPEGGHVVYRVSLPIVVEGWTPDVQIELVPAMWSLVLRGRAEVSPTELETVYSQTTDLRTSTLTNPVMVAREDTLPPYS